MEIRGRVFYVDGYGKEILVDKLPNFLIGVRFGFQPNASASSRSGAEVQQDWFPGRLCLFQR
jgi:hypothetical protein